MTEAPILFSAQMVRAILEGRKTQTRRVIKPQPEISYVERNGGWLEKKRSKGGNEFLSVEKDGGWLKFPYGNQRFKDEIIGSHLWVRENFWKDKDTGKCLGYCADDERKYSNNKTVKKTPSIHMPRWDSRITLGITDIRVERLQDITQADACAEGVLLKSWEACDSFNTTPERQFCKLWKDINGPESWDKNPFVWVIEFKFLEIRDTESGLLIKTQN